MIMSWEDYVVKFKLAADSFRGNVTFIAEDNRRYIQKPSKENVKDNLVWAYNEFVSYRIADEFKLPHASFGIISEGQKHYFCCELLANAATVGDNIASLISSKRAGDILVFDLFVMNSDRITVDGCLHNLLVNGDSILVIDLDKSLLGDGEGDLHRIRGYQHKKNPFDFIKCGALTTLITRWSELIGMIDKVMQLRDEKLDYILRDVPDDWIDEIGENVINELVEFMIGWKYELPGMLYRHRRDLFCNLLNSSLYAPKAVLD